MRKETTSYVKDSSLTFLAKCLNFILRVPTSVLLARMLNPYGKGVFTVVTRVPNMLALFASLGLGIANVYFVGSKRCTFKDAVANSISMALAMGISVVLILLMTHRYYVSKIFPEIDPSYIMLAMVALPFLLLGIYLRNIFQGALMIREFNLIEVVRSAGLLVFLILFLVLFKMAIRGAILCTIFSSVLVVLVALWLLTRFTSITLVFNLSILKDSLAYGMKGHVGNMLQFFNYRLDIFILNYFAGASAVGLYAVSVALAELIWYLPNALALPLFPRIAHLNSDVATSFTAKVCRNTLFMTTIAALGLCVVARIVIYIAYGAPFLASVGPLRILLIGIVALSLSKVITSDLAGRGKPYYVSYLAAISLVITIALDFLLIPRWGINGAAFASTVSYFASGLMAIFWYRKETNVRLKELLLLSRADLQKYGQLGSSFFRRSTSKNNVSC
jgi:O-antigen/teichoic acid export membrane protein